MQSSGKGDKCLTLSGIGSAKKSVTCRRLHFGPPKTTLQNELYKSVFLNLCETAAR